MGKKVVAAVLCLVTACAAYGCSFRRDEREEYDPTKRYLYIGNYNGGLGDAWLNALADEYMAEHSDVVIRIENDKDRFADATLLEQMDNYGYDMYFVNAVTYSNYVGRGKMLDITDVVTEDLDGESESIADKMNPTLKEYYQTDDGKFYAVPFFDSVFGTVYDVDLFESEGLYYNDNGELICNDSSSDTKSAGPNGKSGDYDDGLPATFTQWKDLLDTMKYDFSITPYVWTGEYPYYRYRWLTSMWADYEGKSDFDLNMSFDGTYTFDGDSEPTVITTENAYLLQKQQGKKYALDFAEYVIDGGYYYTSSFDSTYTHMMAQHSYLDSAVYGQRIAMIIEGGWWENEARSFFGEIAAESGDEYAFGVRRFAFMPAPKSDDGKSAPGTTLISSTGNSVAFIAANTSEAELASHCMEDIDKDFVKKVQKGDIIVAEDNFGCGSSREHAPIAIKASGISLVIANSFARIFYRNSINIGLPILECPEAVKNIEAGDVVSCDLSKGEIVNETTGQKFQAEPFPDFIQNIIDKGGLIASIKARG